MAFSGRGGFSSMGGGNMGGGKNNLNDLGYHRRFYYYVPLDNTYVIMQMIVTFIIIIVGLITFLTTYKSTIIDPIESIKKIFVNSYLIIIGVLLVLSLVANFFSKNKTSLIKRLVVVLIISIITILVFSGMKLNLDKTYTKDKFERFYEEENINETSKFNTKSKIDIGITSIDMKTEEEYYIDECIKLYCIFSIKFYGTLGINFLLIIILIYQILRISKIQEKKDKLDKDDAILFDEEQNIKL